MAVKAEGEKGKGRSGEMRKPSQKIVWEETCGKVVTDGCGIPKNPNMPGEFRLVGFDKTRPDGHVFFGERVRQKRF